MIFSRLAHPLGSQSARSKAPTRRTSKTRERRRHAPEAGHRSVARGTIRRMIKAILTDIEGTTSSISFVKDVLFPYARKRLPAFVETHADNPDVQHWLHEAAKEAGLVSATRRRSSTCCIGWIDEDRKVDGAESAAGHDLGRRLRRRRISRARVSGSRPRACASGAMLACGSTSIRRVRSRRRSCCSVTPMPAT